MIVELCDNCWIVYRQELYMYMFICDNYTYECLYTYTLIIDYDWCAAHPQWFWPPTCLYEWVDGVQD